MTKTGSRTAGWRAAALALAACAQSCGGDGAEENRILPLTAAITIPPPAGTAPLVFLRTSSVSGDTVFVDIVLRPMTTLTYDAFAFAFRFNPAILQVGVIKDAPQHCRPGPVRDALRRLQRGRRSAPLHGGHHESDLQR